MTEDKGKAIFVTFILLGVMFQSNLGHARHYDVGDSTGWFFDVAGWEKGKRFNAGDVLVFNYIPGAHNVVVVDKANYDSCSVPPNAKTYRSGSDHITLKKGVNYFICGVPGHCRTGMNIAPTVV